MNINDFGLCNRSEKIDIELTLKYPESQKYTKEINELIKSTIIVEKDDTVNVDYSFDISYFGNTVSNLKNIMTLIQDESVLLNLDKKELLKGVCLIEDLFLTWKKVKDSLEKKTS